MKIKRTKTGNKTSDSKHEIVKTELNGIGSNEDTVPSINCKKQANLTGVLASPSSSANKRGNNSHRKDKVSDLSLINFQFLDENILNSRRKINY